VLTTWVAYWGTLSSDFVSYDDGLYVYENAVVREGLSLESARWALTTTAAANWHPVTWLSHMLDVQLFGLDAGRHHGVNLLLHTVNSVLLLLLLRRMTGALWRSALVAFLFALHPLHVESVAWVSERKDLLSTLFWFLTLAAWLGFLRSRRPARYALAILLYALGLMTKPMLVTLPFTLLLLDFWPLGRTALPPGKARVPLRALLVEKLPFFVLSAASSAVTFWAQRAGGAVQSIQEFSALGRVANASWAYVSYLGKTVWPHSLSVFYPLPDGGHPGWAVAAAVAVLIACTLVALKTLSRFPYLAFGWFWYLGTLIPVIGLVQVGDQAMADRYTYVPLIGIFVAVAWGLGALAGEPRVLRNAVAATCVVALAVFLVLTRWQTAAWRNSQALFEHALSVTRGNHLAHKSLGAILAQEGRAQEAIAHLEEAVHIRPAYASAHLSLGVVLAGEGRLDEAIEHYETALRLEPRLGTAAYNLGLVLMNLGRPEEAAGRFRQAIRTHPELAEAHNSLGVALVMLGLLPEAAEEFRKAFLLKPSHGAADNLGMALARLNRWEEAEEAFRKAVALSPGSADSRNHLGSVLAANGEVPEALEQFREALRLNPNSTEAQQNLRRLEGRTPQNP
jgi:Flp pilus assembly protein TadD